MSKPLAPWLICWLACSIAAFVAPALGAMRVHGLTVMYASMLVSIAFSIVWLLIFVGALRVHGRRGLWLLLGLPTAMVMPVIYLWLLVGLSLCEASGARYCVP
jgi:hypothetical protein